MPYRRPPWAAKVYWNAKQHWLGNFETYEEALAAEDDFRRARGIPTDPAEREKERIRSAHATLAATGTYSNGYKAGTRTTYRRGVPDANPQPRPTVQR